MSTEHEVIDLVDRWTSAELAGDVGAYDELLSPDFVGVGPVGFVLTGQQWAQRHLGDMTNHEFEVSDPEVRVFGDTAIVQAVQRQVTTAMGRESSGSFRLVVVAVKSTETWSIAHIQLSGPLIAPGDTPGFVR